MKSIKRVETLHAKLAQRIKRYEQATGNFPPAEVIDQVRYPLRASADLLVAISAGKDDLRLLTLPGVLLGKFL